jgi:signal peptide peptidase-like protein 2B
MVFLTPFIFGTSVMVDVATAGQPQQVSNPACYCRLNPSDDSVCGVGEVMPILLRLPRLNDYRGGFSMLGLGDIVLPGLLLSYALRTDYELARGLHIRAGSDANERIYSTDGGVIQQPQSDMHITSPTLIQRGSTSSANTNSSISQEIPISIEDSSFSLSTILSKLARYGIILDGLWIIALIGYAVGLLCANFAVAIFQMGQPALLYLVPCTVIPVCAMSNFRGDFDALWRGREVDVGEDFSQGLMINNNYTDANENLNQYSGVTVQIPITSSMSTNADIHPALSARSQN